MFVRCALHMRVQAACLGWHYDRTETVAPSYIEGTRK